MYLCDSNLNTRIMKKTLLFLFAWVCFMPSGLTQTEKVYNILVGDTIRLPLFKQCRNVNYSVSSKEVVKFTPLHYGEKIQVIGQKVGNCTIQATCDEMSTTVVINVTDPTANIESAPIDTKIDKPETIPFYVRYQFNPPSDHFFITCANLGNESRETHAKIGNEEAYNNGNDIDRFWNIQTGDNYYYVPSAQGWTKDVKWDFEPFGSSFFPLNAFAQEVNTDEDLSNYYTGTEKVLDIDCWVFFVEHPDGTVIRYWVDPSNGCTLRRQVNKDAPYEITIYNLSYQSWEFGPNYKKSTKNKAR